MKVILISGKQGSGKTTLQEAYASTIRDMGGAVYLLNFADIIYEMHNAVLDILHKNWPNRGMVKDGPLLQLLGTEWGRKTIDENIWVKILQKRVENIKAGLPSNLRTPTVVIIGDCRFENEFDAFPEAITVRLEADEWIRKQRCSQWRDRANHPSETGLDRYAFDGKFQYMFDTGNVGVEEIVKDLLLF